MHIGRHIVQELVLEFGAPSFERWDVPLTESEFHDIERLRETGRAHDVSLLILDRDRAAVVRKAGHPDGAFRIPSGGIHPEESFLDGAVREAFEVTGLSVHVEDYLLQIHARFTYEDSEVHWTTHVMLARADGGLEIEPRDRDEIVAAQWMDWNELTKKVNPILEKSGQGGLSYRARIQNRLAELTKERSGAANE